MNSSSKLKCLLPVICSLLPHITMRRTGVIILNFKRFIVFHKLTRTDKIRTKNKDLSKFLWSLWKELTLGWSKRGWNYPEEGFSIPCISNHNPSPASAIPCKRGVPEVIEKERFFWFDFTGWWLVDADGEVGWAPALYLEPADEMSDTEVSNVQRFPISKGTLHRVILPTEICDTK